MKTAYTIRTIKDAYLVLEREKDLSPRNPAVNDALTRLVKALSQDFTPAEEQCILSDPEVRRQSRSAIKNLARAESEMEYYWAEKFCENNAITQLDLENFWYWENYQGLVDGETPNFPKTQYQANESICFVGSGPLPLTAIVLNQKTGTKITCVDIDPVACDISRELIGKAGYSDRIEVVCADGADYGYRTHPAILIASLVPNKADVVTRIKETAKTPCIALRSAEHLHTLLYNPVNEHADVFNSCTQTAKTPYDPKIINTTLFYHVPQDTKLGRDAALGRNAHQIWEQKSIGGSVLSFDPAL